MAMTTLTKSTLQNHPARAAQGRPQSQAKLRPQTLLRLEGAAVFAAAIALYAHLGGNGLAFALLLFVPDVSMIGYLRGPAVGAAVYNAGHFSAGPLALGVISLLLGWLPGVQLALIWGAHIGLDRTLGYGLKFASDFKDTHLNHR
jgi:hypothetical protein